MANPKFALNIGEIENAVNTYSALKPAYTFSLDKRENQFLYKVGKDGNEVSLTLYILKGGMVSHQVQSKKGLSDIASVAEDCWEYVVENTHIQCSSCNFFKLSNVEEEEFSDFIDLASNGYGYIVNTVDNPNDTFKCRKTIEDQYGARLSINYYNNGTLTLQGALSPMFTYMWTECVSLLGDIEEEERNEFISYSTSAPQNVLDPNLSSHIDNLAPMTGNKIDLFAEVSIKLANLGIVCEDNAWISFSVLKGLDALISLKLTGGNPTNSFDVYSEFFIPSAVGSDDFVFKTAITTYDGNAPLKRALEEAYSYLRLQRNTSFHIDRANVATSRIVAYEEAVDIITECLKYMNRICRNW